MGDWMGMLGHPLVREENNVENPSVSVRKGQGVPSLKTLTEAEAEVGTRQIYAVTGKIWENGG